MVPSADAPGPVEGARSRLEHVEWEVVEQVPGDPWTAELVVWAGESIDGLVIPLDDSLMGAISDVRRRQGDVVALDLDEPAADDQQGEREGVAGLLRGLGRSTGSTQADRWLAGVPVRVQIAGGVLLLVVFVLVMVIGNLR